MLGTAVLGGGCQDGAEGSGVGEGLDLARGEGAFIDAHVLQEAIFEELSCASLSDLQRGPGRDVGIRLEGATLHALGLLDPIVIEAESLRLAASVVGDKDVVPLAEFEDRFLGNDLEGVVGIVIDEVGPEVRALLPEIPATVLPGRIHASEDRAIDATRRTDPGTVAEGLIDLEVGEVTEVKGAAPLDAGSGTDLALGIPGEEALGLKGFFLSLDRAFHLIAQSFVERDMHEKAFPGLGFGQLIRVGGGSPLFKVGFCFRSPVFKPGLGLRDLLVERLPFLPVLVEGNLDDRSASIGGVAVHCTLGGVSEEGCHGVVVLCGEGIKLVIVALGTVGGQTKVDPAEGLHAVSGIDGEVLLCDCPSLVGGDVTALEAGGDKLIKGGLGKKVSSQLPDGEFVIGQVLVEGLHHPVAIGVDLTVVVKVQAVRVTVARRIKPVTGAMLPVTW